MKRLIDMIRKNARTKTEGAESVLMLFGIFLLSGMLVLTAMPLKSMAEKGSSGWKTATPSDYQDGSEEDDSEDKGTDESLSEEAPEEEEDLLEEDGWEPDKSLDDKVVTSEAKETGAAALLEKEVKKEKEAEITTEVLVGRWTVDGRTDLLFQKDGSGSMITPERRFTLQWELEDGRLKIQFDNDAVRDVIYTVSGSEDSLVITDTVKDEAEAVSLRKKT